MRLLIAGPDYGLELGWLCCRWQAKIRFLSQLYDNTFVITSQEMFPLYRDFTMHINAMPEGIKASKNMWRYDGVEIDYIHPSKEFCCKRGENKFVQYGDREEFSKKSVICIHPRNKNDGREWPKSKWNEFVSNLKKHVDLRTVSIGSKDCAHDVVGTEDYRGKSLDCIFRLFDITKIIIGPSSGPLHLASLCGCPQLLWTDNKPWNLGVCKGTNRERYEHVWNPLNTPVTVIDENGWNPPVGLVLSKTKELLDD